MMPIILASASPRRQELLKNLGLDFTIKVSEVDETLEKNLAPAEQVERLAAQKATTVAKDVVQGLVIGADTLVVLDHTPLGKPADDAEAIRMLSNLQGKSHQVFTGLTVIDAATGKSVVTHEETTVYFKPMSQDQIERYVATGEPLDKAGAYAVQGKASIFITGIRGCYFNVVGLPVGKLAEALKEFGVEII